MQWSPPIKIRTSQKKPSEVIQILVRQEVTSGIGCVLRNYEGKFYLYSLNIRGYQRLPQLLVVFFVTIKARFYLYYLNIHGYQRF